jgi:predicted MPP superfamily phosphohydrolase
VARFAVFLLIVLSVWTLLHAYAFLRVASLLPIGSSLARTWLIVAAVALWLCYPLARVLSSRVRALALLLDAVGSVWIGALFLLVVCFLAADLATGFGFLFREHVPRFRAAALAAAGLLSAAALVQGLRAPEVTERTVKLAGLPAERDGLVVVLISDLHLGPLRSEGWLARRIADVDALEPDLVAVVGDVLDQEALSDDGLVPVLRTLRAPLGVFAVTGNHEFYAGLDRAVGVLKDAGLRVLEDEAVEAAPGLVVAGVHDLTARRQLGVRDGFPDRALRHRPPGAVIYLCHSPSQVERAAELGAGLMLSGHTHDGQIWPFRWLVKLAYPRVTGVHQVAGMTLVVLRGTGTWGPPMRLFRRSEIARITLERP